MIQFIVIENDPQWAKLYEESGVHRIMVDLETLGKAERQGHLDTVRSDHTLGDISSVRAVLSSSQLLVRVNPWNPSSFEEIEEVLGRGAEIIMLPMFQSLEEVSAFCDAVSGRAKTCLLLETPQALSLAKEIISHPAVDELFVGLNDLSLGLKLDFLFEPLADGTIDRIASLCRDARTPFGFGGVGPVDGGDVPGSAVIGEHARLGSTLVILSRTFRALARSNPDQLRDEVKKLQDEYLAAARRSPQDQNASRENTNRLISAVVEKKRRQRLSNA